MRKTIFILFFALLGILSARAYNFKVDGIYYNITNWYDREVEVTYGENRYDYNSYSGSVVIPATVTYGSTTYTVTSIGERAFESCSGLTSVTIPESVTSIGLWAFYGCTSISSPLYNSKIFAYLPENYSGDYTIPTGIQSIAGGAFSDCNGLTSVTIPESVTSIGLAAFNGTSISSPLYTQNIFAYMPRTYSGEYAIPSGIQLIAGGAFDSCSGLTSVTIPESVTSIGDGAFIYCSGLTSVTIPESVTTIGDAAFYGCSGLTSVTIPNSVTSIGYAAFADCSGLTSVTIPDSVTTIGYAAFADCSGLTSVTIPESVDYIGPEAFYGCSGLTSVTIGEGVTSIGYSAFSHCSGLTSVTIPNSVTSIGHSAFSHCSGLTSVEWNAIGCQDFNYLYYSDFPFFNCGNITSITFGNQVERIPAYLCHRMYNLMSVTIPESVDTIGSYAFYKCTGLTSVTIPESVDTIGSYAFYGCTSIDIPLYNSSIFAYMPENYIGEYTIPSGILTIAGGAFSDCRRLTSVTIPESVTSIGDAAFERCSGLTSVTIPDSVTSIGNSAFWGCTGSTSVTIGERVTTIGEGAFSGCSGLTSMVWNAVACRDFSSDNPPFSDNENITSVTFGKQVEHIPAFLCYGLSGLTAITLPGSVDTVGKAAFKECNYLLSVTSLSKTPPYCFYDEENSVFSVYGTLFVPKGSKKAYQTAQEWYKFSRIEETETTYTVTVNVNDAVMGRVTGSGEYQEGEQAILAAIPNQGYRFVRWDDGSTNNPRIMTVNEDITLTAVFAANESPKTYTVTAQPNDTTMGTVTGGGKYEEDKRATLAAIPNKGYYFDRWDDGNTDNPRTLTVRKNITLTAIFVDPTANEISEADNFGVYVQDRTIHLSEDRGLVQVYNMAGQCVYNGHATAIPVQQPGVYILRLADGRSRKIIVR